MPRLCECSFPLSDLDTFGRAYCVRCRGLIEDDEDLEQELAERYPEWSGSLSTHYDEDCIFVDENGEDR